jgi:two-component system OmpR family sensor kinase
MGLLHADGLAWALGLAPRRIEVAGASVIVAPDLRSVEAALNESALALFLASLLAVVLSWLCARWLAAHALAPMIAVTEQLERFSSGDFKTRPIETNERAELGRLIGAYNGAVAQVDRALGERVETEQRLRRFLADAGHELRTPITVIGGYVEILRKGGFDDAVIRETALATLTGEVRRSRELVERLMRLVTLERPELSATTAVDVETLAREAIANVTRARGGDVTLACAAPAAVTADPAELQEAIGNLVDNALKYGGGTPVAVTVEPQGSDVFVRVRDGGPGIAPADRERIFERFFRAAEVRDVEGSGLGLAICERAVARCGGTVLLEDPAPGSTTFRLTLPAARMQRDGNAPIRF